MKGQAVYGSPDLGPNGAAPGSTYSITVEFVIPTHNSRFFAIPLLGFLARFVLLIPQLLVLMLLTYAVALLQLVLWVPVLFGGAYPRWGYAFVGGYLRWNLRTTAYFYGLTDAYPPFRLSN